MADISNSQTESERPRKNDMLKMYYGIDDSTTPSHSDSPLDIDSSNFSAELYLRKLKQVNIIFALCDTYIL